MSPTEKKKESGKKELFSFKYENSELTETNHLLMSFFGVTVEGPEVDVGLTSLGEALKELGYIKSINIAQRSFGGYNIDVRVAVAVAAEEEARKRMDELARVIGGAGIYSNPHMHGYSSESPEADAYRTAIDEIKKEKRIKD